MLVWVCDYFIVGLEEEGGICVVLGECGKGRGGPGMKEGADRIGKGSSGVVSDEGALGDCLEGSGEGNKCERDGSDGGSS